MYVLIIDKLSDIKDSDFNLSKIKYIVLKDLALFITKCWMVFERNHKLH